jgi:integrase
LASIEDRWFDTAPDGRRARTDRHGKGMRWRVRYTGTDGRAHAKSFARKDDADRFRDTTAADVRRGTWIDPDAGTITLREFADSWLARQRTEASTREAVGTRLNRHIYPVLAGFTLAQLARDPALTGDWLAALTVSDAYRRVVFTTLSAIMNDAVRRKLIPANPCLEVKRPKPPASRAGSWTPQQVAAVRAALPGRWQVLVDLGARLGLRQGEIFGLAVPDVDFLRRVVHVRRQVRIVGGRLVFAPPKGRKIRDVPLPQTVADALAAHLAAYPARPVTLPWNEPGGAGETAQLVLTSATGLAVNRNTFNTYAWKPALAAAGIPAGRASGCHVLRHTFASELLHHGCGIKEVSDYLGHSSAAITLGIYAHAMPAAHDRMRDTIDALAAQDHVPGMSQAGVS